MPDLLKVYRAFAATGAREKSGSIMYAMGWTQHSVGVQNIRLMTMIQMVLGNIGLPGGGVNALRGESNVQGSTDHCLLFHIWPGYLPAPRASLATLADYNRKNTPHSPDPLSANWWQNRPKYVASFLKAMFGEAANAGNDFGYSWLPKLDDGVSYSWLDLFKAMGRGEVKGFFAWGQNPACSGADANQNRRAMARLDWLVNVNIFDTETAEFWRGPGMDPKKIPTEVFFLPCATSVEKEGSITNSGRWMQWRHKAVEPLAGTKPDGEIMTELFAKIRALYAREGGRFPQPILNLRLDFAPGGRFDAAAAARLINGYFEKDTVFKGKAYKKRPAGAVFRCAGGRRLHLQRQLALLPVLHRSRQPGGPAGQGRPHRPGGCIPAGPGAGRSTGAYSTTGPGVDSAGHPWGTGQERASVARGQLGGRCAGRRLAAACG